MASPKVERLRAVVHGAVQGVGFRPFVYRLATGLSLTGYVLNSSQGVFIEAEGPSERLREFILRLEQEKPPRAIIQSLEFSFLDPLGYSEFHIQESQDTGVKTTLVIPDIASCSECLQEVSASTERRFLYPFTNCTNCGPRFTIIQALPYDRPNTSMQEFRMCSHCQGEYEDPLDRRFHAQPIACPQCGPTLTLWNEAGETLALGHEALVRGAELVGKGGILGFKGLGGFLLLADARNDEAVIRLRDRKRREEKPFALMFPSLDSVKSWCEVSPLETRLLTSPESPIVLLKKKPGTSVARSVAPQNPYQGAMLPYTPLHHLIASELGFPVVATSGNLTDEPIVTDEREALTRLGGIADAFLVHNRPIVRHSDDSVTRIVLGKELILRRARGYAPLPILVKEELPKILAVGAHLKNTIAISVGNQVFVSQHIGDLETEEAYDAFLRTVEDFKRLYEFEPEAVACDLHPDFPSTNFARGLDLPVVPVQHHHAHAASCIAENQLEGPVLAVTWDGLGFGLDGTAWGGEFLLVDGASFQRLASFRTFRMPGGEKAIKEPRRTALALLYEVLGEEALEREELPTSGMFRSEELRILRRMLLRGVNSPLTSSVGRLFDGIAALLGLRRQVNFEGQAAMELEWCVEEGVEGVYPFDVSHEGLWLVDWGPMVLELLRDLRLGRSSGEIAAKFHNTLVEALVQVAQRIKEKRVVLTGGVFQNRYLTERAFLRLEQEGFRVYTHQRVPPNDGGISLGQVLVAAAQLRS